MPVTCTLCLIDQTCNQELIIASSRSSLCPLIEAPGGASQAQPRLELCSGLASLRLAKTLPTVGPEREAWEGFNGHKSEHLLSNRPSLRFANGNPRTQSQPKGVGSIQTQPHSSARPSSEEPDAF